MPLTRTISEAFSDWVTSFAVPRAKLIPSTYVPPPKKGRWGLHNAVIKTEADIQMLFGSFLNNWLSAEPASGEDSNERDGQCLAVHSEMTYPKRLFPPGTVSRSSIAIDLSVYGYRCQRPIYDDVNQAELFSNARALIEVKYLPWVAPGFHLKHIGALMKDIDSLAIVANEVVRRNHAPKPSLFHLILDEGFYCSGAGFNPAERIALKQLHAAHAEHGIVCLSNNQNICGTCGP